MLITIGLFLAVVILLLIGYVGEILTSAAEREGETDTSKGFELDPAIEGSSSR
jgi:hypothetical protein